MSTHPSQAEVREWRRRFGVQCQQRAWELAQLTERNEAQEREMLESARTAVLYLEEVGSPSELARAEAIQDLVVCLLHPASDAPQTAPAQAA